LVERSMLSQNVYSKPVRLLSPIHKEGNEPCFIYTIKYGCTTFIYLVI